MQKTLFLLSILLTGARSELLSVTHVKPLISSTQYNQIRDNAHTVLSKLASSNNWYTPNFARWNIAYYASDSKTKEMMNQISNTMDYGDLLNFCDANNSKIGKFVDTATSLATTTSIDQKAQMGSQTLETANMGLELFSDAQSRNKHFVDVAVKLSKGEFTEADKTLLLSALPLAMRCKGGVTGALSNQPAFGDMIFYARVEEEVSGPQKEQYSDAKLSAQSTCERSAIPTMSRDDRFQLADLLQNSSASRVAKSSGGSIEQFINALKA